jgi:hypothetical protein
LKELLDEKDEKIDMLSKLHSSSAQSAFHNSPRRPSASSVAPSPNTNSEDVFHVQQTLQLDGNGTNAHFAGTSSGKSFYGAPNYSRGRNHCWPQTDAFSRRVQELGRPAPAINAQDLLPGSTHIAHRGPLSDPIVWRAPARLESDQLIGIFFQEWAPLFPILHRPTFLELYQLYMSGPENVVDNCSHAQLNLVFGIAALSSGVSASADYDWTQLKLPSHATLPNFNRSKHNGKQLLTQFSPITACLLCNVWFWHNYTACNVAIMIDF